MGDTVHIPLWGNPDGKRGRSSEKEIKGYALVDSANYGWLMQWDWGILRARQSGKSKTAYAYRSETVNGRTVHIYMHREILGLPHRKGDIETHHENGNGLDNRRANLSAVPARKHLRNHFLEKQPWGVSSESGERNIYWDPKGEYWVAAIAILGKRLRKRFKSIDEARHQVHQWQSLEAVS